MIERSSDPISHLYVHVPFCARKCAYCAFYSEPSSSAVIDRYVEALIRELKIVAADLEPRTVFFGGGTPSLLNVRQWERILNAMNRLNLLGAREWTIECNPTTVSPDKAHLLRSGGVNRVSMGVQSLDDHLLDRLGRIHSREMVFKSFDVLRSAGFDNLNLDLMFAIPGQTLRTWQETLREAMAMGSEHLSSYEVIYEEDTELFAQLEAGEIDADEDLACSMYDELVVQATGAGFKQYEVSNFARVERAEIASSKSTAQSLPVTDLSSQHLTHGSQLRTSGTRRIQGGGETMPACTEAEDRFGLALPVFVCRHNVNYWRGGSFYGLGPSATSYVRGVRTKNWSNTQIYCEQLEQGKLPVESREELESVARAGETAAFGLRLLAGWPFEQFRQVTGYDLRHEWASEMAHLTARGWARLTPDRFRLTPVGLRFADAAAQAFLR